MAAGKLHFRNPGSPERQAARPPSGLAVIADNTDRELAGDDALVVPREAAVLLAQVLGYLANGEGVNVMPDSAELTTQQAADFLNVSRPHLIKLLESEKIPFRLVGTHRRIKFKDLSEYKSRDDLERRRVADWLRS